MDLMLKWESKKNDSQIAYQQKIMLIGSCFTEHIGNFLLEHKFDVLQNPNGILFDSLSVCRSIISYIENKRYTEENIFQNQELWQSWQHHSRFSGMQKEVVLFNINESQQKANQFLQKTDWLIITLGSSFAYKLKKESAQEYAMNEFVSNCHKAPANWFEKYLIPIEEQISNLDNVIHRLKMINPSINIIFTISPVRHIRDGVVENNRSKARLIETVHHLCNKFNGLYYFPAYEILIDVLRDYRFYDIDLVHPNYTATQFVLKHFVNSFIEENSIQLLERIKPIIISKKHKAFNPESLEHKKFLQQNINTINKLISEFPFLDFTNELKYFTDVVI